MAPFLHIPWDSSCALASTLGFLIFFSFFFETAVTFPFDSPFYETCQAHGFTPISPLALKRTTYLDTSTYHHLSLTLLWANLLFPLFLLAFSFDRGQEHCINEELESFPLHTLIPVLYVLAGACVAVWRQHEVLILVLERE